MGKYERLTEANTVFTPGFPVRQKDMFAGRATQLERTIGALSAPGRHPVIFGQRGVGKTSLANILGQVLQQLLTVKISCDGSDTFASVWNRVLRNASVNFKTNALGFSGEEATKSISLGEALGHDANTTKPAEIADLLNRVDKHCVIILDEFDKVTDLQAKSAFADLIKILSDNAPLVTIIIVGVAENILELIGEHPSIDRNLVQIELPTMSNEEISKIFTSGLERLRVQPDLGISEQVQTLASGFPHYAHLLGLSAIKACAENDTYILTQTLFEIACNLAVEDSIEKYRDAFSKATATTQVSRYPQILSACAYASRDDRGVFRATDVVDAISEVFNEKLTVQAVVPALGEFLKDHRASVLESVMKGGRMCYRFRDPMMRPFCRLKAREILSSK